MSKHCDFCGKTIEHGIDMLYADDACICDECLEICDEIIQEERELSGHNEEEKREDLAYCSFCGRNQNMVEKMIVGPTQKNICSLCVEYINYFMTADFLINNPIENYLDDIDEEDDDFEEIISAWLDDTSDDNDAVVSDNSFENGMKSESENQVKKEIEDIKDVLDNMHDVTDDNSDSKDYSEMDNYEVFLTLCKESYYSVTEAAKLKVKGVFKNNVDPNELFSQVRLNQVSRVSESDNIEINDYSIIDAVDIP